MALIDFDVLWRLVVGSLAAGFGATLAFSLVIYGATRFVDLRRDGHGIVAGAFGLLAVIALAAVLAGMVYGVWILTNKG